MLGLEQLKNNRVLALLEKRDLIAFVVPLHDPRENANSLADEACSGCTGLGSKSLNQSPGRSVELNLKLVLGLFFLRR